VAEHLTLGSKVALKLIDPALARNRDAQARFVQEARAASALRSPHVVQILDHGIEDGVPFIAMELLEGESLAARLARVGRLSAVDTARVITEVARAVGKAHDAGIIHRDLKPDNVFLVANDDIEIAKVLDFGVAKAVKFGPHEGAMTQTGAVLGSPFYMSPEQAEASKSLDHRTDIWSLSVIAYECVVGRRPFEGETLASLLLAICSKPPPVPSNFGVVPEGFDDWFARGVARDPDRRFASTREAAAELRDVAGAPPMRPSHHPGQATSVPDLARHSLTTGGMAASADTRLPSASSKVAIGIVATAVVVLTVTVVFKLDLFSDRVQTASEAPAMEASPDPDVPAEVAIAEPIPESEPVVTPATAPSSTVSSAAPSTKPTSVGPQARRRVETELSRGPPTEKEPRQRSTAAPPPKPSIDLGL
jgi:serine/threonine-protein kinase